MAYGIQLSTFKNKDVKAKSKKALTSPAEEPWLQQDQREEEKVTEGENTQTTSDYSRPKNTVKLTNIRKQRVMNL